MIVPSVASPSTLGVEWGMSIEIVLDVLREARYRGKNQIELELRVEEEKREVLFSFDEKERLERVELELYRSRDFWEADLQEVEVVMEEYTEMYRLLLKEYTVLLGNPVFSEMWDWNKEGYPDDEVWGDLTYWNTKEGQVRLLYVQEDRELPMHITLVWHP